MFISRCRSKNTPLTTKASKYYTIENQGHEKALFDGIERDLDKYADKRVKEMYKQTVLTAKTTNIDQSQTNAQWMTRNTSWDNEPTTDTQKNLRKTGFDSFKQFIAVAEGKERKIACSIYQKLKAKAQQPCEKISLDQLANFCLSVSREGDESLNELDGGVPEIGTIKSMNEVFSRPSYQQGRVIINCNES